MGRTCKSLQRIFLRLAFWGGFQSFLGQKSAPFIVFSFPYYSEGSVKTPGGPPPATLASFSSAIPARAIVPSSNKRPIRVTPCGTRRGGENFGSGLAGSGAQSLRASATCTVPVRSVSEGWPVLFEIVSISSRSDG